VPSQPLGIEGRPIRAVSKAVSYDVPCLRVFGPYSTIMQNKKLVQVIVWLVVVSMVIALVISAIALFT
jgi:Sec-independent protein secretion pathway component TatC